MRSGNGFRYVYGKNGKLLREYDINGNRIREYIYFPYGNTQELVAQIEADGSIIYIHTDHLSTLRLATNQEQAVIWTWVKVCPMRMVMVH